METPKPSLTRLMIYAAEKRWLSDSLIRRGMRKLLTKRLEEMHEQYLPSPGNYMQNFSQRLGESELAEETDVANRQHYEVPPEFYMEILGPRLKYSSCLYPDGSTTLEEAEDAMLALTVERAGISGGHHILELGCGWGSLSLYMAENYPDATITAVSNSRFQKEFIDARASEKGFQNLTVITQDINTLVLDHQVDRIVSVEMFEHVRNYNELFKRCRSWIKPNGQLFIHVFAHKQIPYLFEDNDPTNWMTRYFFSGGTMPSHDVFSHCQDSFDVKEDWIVSGHHYSRTLEDWLNNMDTNERTIVEIFTKHYSVREADIWVQRWRMFMMACSELFAFNEGNEWRVSHFRLVPK